MGVTTQFPQPNFPLYVAAREGGGGHCRAVKALLLMVVWCAGVAACVQVVFAEAHGIKQLNKDEVRWFPACVC